MKTSVVMRTAMRHVEKGWTQGRLSDVWGNVCMLGAISRTSFYGTGFQEDRFKFYVEAHRALTEKVRELGWTSVVHMNDAPSTTKQDCLNIMEKTAISLEEHGD